MSARPSLKWKLTFHFTDETDEIKRQIDELKRFLESQEKPDGDQDTCSQLPENKEPGADDPAETGIPDGQVDGGDLEN